MKIFENEKRVIVCTKREFEKLVPYDIYLASLIIVDGNAVVKSKNARTIKIFKDMKRRIALRKKLLKMDIKTIVSRSGKKRKFIVHAKRVRTRHGSRS